MFGMVKEKYGRLDLLFNNAGIDLLNSVPLEEADMSLFRKVLDVNVMAAVLVRLGLRFLLALLFHLPLHGFFLCYLPLTRDRTT